MSKIDDLIKDAPAKQLFPDLSERDKEESRLIVYVADKIYYRRKELGMTQKELADILGVTQSMVSQLESGEYNFSIGLLTKIFDALKMDININLFDVSQKTVASIISSGINVINSRLLKSKNRKSGSSVGKSVSEVA